MLDYDLGWRGKCQFFFGMKNDGISAGQASPDNDNGIEADADDNKVNSTPRSHPVIYNVTLIGNSKVTGTSDNSGIAAIQAKELTEGEIYNSIFANWRNGLNLVKSLGTGRAYPTGESWNNWFATGTTGSVSSGNGSQSLKVKCNHFVNATNPLTVGASSGAAGTNLTAANSSDAGISAEIGRAHV